MIISNAVFICLFSLCLTSVCFCWFSYFHAFVEVSSYLKRPYFAVAPLFFFADSVSMVAVTTRFSGFLLPRSLSSFNFFQLVFKSVGLKTNCKCQIVWPGALCFFQFLRKSTPYFETIMCVCVHMCVLL